MVPPIFSCISLTSSFSKARPPVFSKLHVGDDPISFSRAYDVNNCRHGFNMTLYYRGTQRKSHAKLRFPGKLVAYTLKLLCHDSLVQDPVFGGFAGMARTIVLYDLRHKLRGISAKPPNPPPVQDPRSTAASETHSPRQRARTYAVKHTLPTLTKHISITFSCSLSDGKLECKQMGCATISPAQATLQHLQRKLKAQQPALR